MSALCPNGHSSQATDYCDICGEPMAAAAAAPAPAAAQAAATTPRLCPTCGSTSAPMALFCENCGFDFTTGTPSTPIERPSSLTLDPPTPTAPAQSWFGGDVAGGAAPAPEAGNDPEAGSAVAAGSDPGAGQAPEADPEGGLDLAAGAEVEAGGDPGADPVRANPEPGVDGDGDGGAAGSDPDPSSDPALDPDPGLTPSAVIRRNLSPVPPVGSDPSPSTRGSSRTWVAEVWVDPDWYAEQHPEDPMPSVGAPSVVALRGGSILVGRPSRSRGIDPQVDCGADTGVSRRHAQLTTDGQRWWVEDLQSANGTYVSPVGDPLPLTPIPAGERVEVDEGTRIFVGGWTRVVVREAFPGEA